MILTCNETLTYSLATSPVRIVVQTAQTAGKVSLLSNGIEIHSWPTAAALLQTEITLTSGEYDIQAVHSAEKSQTVRVSV